MPTKRTRISRQRRDRDVPDWARRLRDHGELPEREVEPDWGAFIAWFYFDDQVPGLPLARSREGRRLVEQAKAERAGAGP